MKRALALTLLLTLLLCSCGEQPQQLPDFRAVRWGMSEQEVTNAEGTDYLYADETLMMFEGTELSRNCELYYEFTDGGLSSAACRFKVDEGMILADFVAIYEQLFSQLEERYGSPIEPDYRIWSNEEDRALYEPDGDPPNIYWQRLVYRCSWQAERSDISLSLDYTDLQINLVLLCEQRPEAA